MRNFETDMFEAMCKKDATSLYKNRIYICKYMAIRNEIRIYTKENSWVSFSLELFNDYFYSKKEMRKIKLEKINASNL